MLLITLITSKENKVISNIPNNTLKFFLFCLNRAVTMNNA